MYNEMYFHSKPPNTMSTTADLPSNTIDKIAFKVHDRSTTFAAPPNVTSIPDNTSHESTWQTPAVEQLLEPSHVSVIDLHNTVNVSTDKLFLRSIYTSWHNATSMVSYTN